MAGGGAVSDVRVGVVGAGAIAQVAHLPVLRKLKGVQVVGICDSDGPKARALAARFETGRAYDDIEAARRLAADCAVVTYELEHVSLELVRALDDGRVAIRPGPYALRLTQDRLAERGFLEANGAALAPWRRRP